MATTAIHAKQVTITPVRGSVWFVDVDQLGYLLIKNDSIVAYNNKNQEQGKDALTNTHRIAVEESPTALPPLRATHALLQTFDIIGRPTQPNQGIYVIQLNNETKKVLVK